MKTGGYQTLTHLLLGLQQWIIMKAMKAIGRSKNMQKRLEAEERLKVLAEKTVQTYSTSRS
jgi:hypothetical protein